MVVRSGRARKPCSCFRRGGPLAPAPCGCRNRLAGNGQRRLHGQPHLQFRGTRGTVDRDANGGSVEGLRGRVADVDLHRQRLRQQRPGDHAHRLTGHDRNRRQPGRHLRLHARQRKTVGVAAGERPTGAVGWPATACRRPFLQPPADRGSSSPAWDRGRVAWAEPVRPSPGRWVSTGRFFAPGGPGPGPGPGRRTRRAPRRGGAAQPAVELR